MVLTGVKNHAFRTSRRLFTPIFSTFRDFFTPNFILCQKKLALLLATFKAILYLVVLKKPQCMNIHFNLKSPSAEKSPIRLIITHRGVVYRKSIGISCQTDQWSVAKGKCLNATINKKLQIIQSSLLSDLDEFSTPKDIDTAIAKALDTAFGRETKEDTPKVSNPETKAYIDYFKEWSERESTSIRQRKLAYTNILSLMGQSSWDEVNESYCYRLVRKMEDKGWGINYQGNMIKAIKVVMNEGLKLGYHSNRAFLDFKAPHAEVDNIYLTADEMEKLWTADVHSSLKSKSRDLAWLGYLTCARFSDYSRLTDSNIGTDGKIRFSQQKTSRQVVLPCSPRVREILARNGGKAPELSHQKFNQYIKELCKDCGIDDKVEVVAIKGARRERSVLEKWQLVSSHTFRRSAATNLYLQGVPLRSIMQLTGHSSIAMLEKYLKVGGEENALRLADNPFFK